MNAFEADPIRTGSYEGRFYVWILTLDVMFEARSLVRQGWPHRPIPVLCAVCILSARSCTREIWEEMKIEGSLSTEEWWCHSTVLMG